VISEHAVLRVTPGREDEFLAAMEQARAALHQFYDPPHRWSLSCSRHAATQPQRAETP
jgi:hypothetical protein